MNPGVLVVGHGSKLDLNQELVVDAAAKMAEMGEFGPVTAAFMQINEPTIEDGLVTLVRQGVDLIYVQPCFLASGIHITKDIPKKIGLQVGETEGTVNIEGRSVVVRYCEPIGKDNRIADILADRVRERAQKA